jgi:hypothetical protein
MLHERVRKDALGEGRAPNSGETKTRCLYDNGLVCDIHADRPAGRPAVVSSLGAFPHHGIVPARADEGEYLTPISGVSRQGVD